MPKISGLMVYPLMQDWHFEFNETGSSGIRVYMEQLSSSEPGTPEELPGIGDSWDGPTDAYKDCRVQRIKVEYIQNYYETQGNRCSRKFTCFYETSYIDTQADQNDGIEQPTDTDLTIAVETSGELISIDPSATNPSHGYKWYSDDTAVTQPIYKTINTTTLKIQRMIRDVDFGAWLDTSDAALGKINDAICLSFQKDTLMYTGFTASPWRSETNTPKWRCELTFVGREVTGKTTAGDDGWNFVLRETRTKDADPLWDEPYIVDDTGTKVQLYSETSFDNLFTVGLETTSKIPKAIVPEK